MEFEFVRGSKVTDCGNLGTGNGIYFFPGRKSDRRKLEPIHLIYAANIPIRGDLSRRKNGKQTYNIYVSGRGDGRGYTHVGSSTENEGRNEGKKNKRTGGKRGRRVTRVPAAAYTFCCSLVPAMKEKV